MADNDDKDTQHVEHTIRGAVPAEEFGRFFSQHFSPSSSADQTQVAARPRPTDATSICASLGCPTTFRGRKLKSCSVDVESDGSTTIHCRYELASGS